MKAKISNRLVSELKARKKPFEVRDTQLNGFILRVQPSGSMSYYAEYGRGKRISIGRTDALTVAQARDEARKRLAGAALGQDPMDERKTEKAYDLGTFLTKEYERHMVTTWKTGKCQVDRIRSSFQHLFNKKLPEITPWAITKYRSRRLKAGKQRVTARTVNRDVAALKAALNRAVEWKLIKENPLATVKAIKEDNKQRVRYLSEPEEKRLRKALDDREEKLTNARERGNAWRRERGYPEFPALRDRLKPMVLLSVNTGIRQGELFNLQRADIDLDRKVLTIEGAGAKTSLTRHVPLNTQGAQILENWKTGSEGYVFPSDSGGRLDNVRKSWATVLKAAKITDFRWHDLRHTFASNLVMAEVDLNTVRELLGHADINMTLRYAHLAPEHKAAAVERLAR